MRKAGRVATDMADRWLALVTYGPSDLMESKLKAIRRHIHKCWAVLTVGAPISRSIITFIPVLLMTFALPRRGLRERSRENRT